MTKTLPATISVRRVEEDAGYMAMTPVLTQAFRLDELVDMVVSVAGKDARRVQHILSAGAVLYHGYHYSWQGFEAEPGKIDALLEKFPNDEPDRVFDAESATAAILEIGGGVQRTFADVSRGTASGRRLLSRRSPWDVLLALTRENPARYEKYDHGRHGDLFRVSLRYEDAEHLLERMREAAPRKLRFDWRGLRPPAAVIFVCPRDGARAR